MTTYPIHRPDGSLRGFEITATWLTFGSLRKLLREVPGVAEVRRQWFNDDRIKFMFHGKPAVVNEPWGDNSRYWVGLEEPDAFPDVDITPIHEAFKSYRGLLVTNIWPFGKHAG